MSFRYNLSRVARALLPARLRSVIRSLATVWPRPQQSTSAIPASYADLYETQARALHPEESIGGGDYDTMGSIMLSALVDAGLQPHHSLVDFGCGTGRLAVHAIPLLREGRYIGIDISEAMLEHARRRTTQLALDNPREVAFLHQTTPVFELPEQSIDFFAAFSVFTHMEHEDCFLYLRDARRVVRSDGRFVLSCLTLDLADAQTVFLQSATLRMQDRWLAVRNVTTTYDLMNRVATLAGWRVRRWYRGDHPMIPSFHDNAQRVTIGQSVCVLEPGKDA